MIVIGGMHQSLTGTLAKWFSDNFPVFADSFSVLSTHCLLEDKVQASSTSAVHRAVVPCDSTAFLLFFSSVPYSSVFGSMR